ncbi:hypothetical protein MW941_002696 [Salmonella enterica]|uniref:hypothetical protein n=1 Tax=Salmonella enterica TaxID=28901 RepID=UPI00111A44A5|nr:hypothetical protein [Salmonella enterica]ECI0840662.1 hypothetical protein [Salmonella enterica subsp. diarizonae]WGI49791.1 hypothetical protein QBX66_25530 [Salmonella enterica subsp. diarizonae serovar 48:i:z]EAV1166978.1 hypothetical protein [Salmonella enterica]ECG0086741.1 hypothetical protein [Salmonella enterica]ECG8185903.1 hypothetical protein [Salmonella enterica]
MMVIPLSELRKKLDRHGYIPQSCEDNDELIQLLDIRGPTPAGVLHHDNILHWLSESDLWNERFPSRPLSRADQYPLRLALEIHSTLALAESRTVTALADCNHYPPGKFHHLRQLLASVLYDFALRLTTFRFDSANPQLPGGLFPVINDLRQLADDIFSDHNQKRPVERVEMDRLATIFARIHLRFDEWCADPIPRMLRSR